MFRNVCHGDDHICQIPYGGGGHRRTDATKVVPRRDLDSADFKDIWLVGDYSDKNGATNGGFIAIRLMNALSTGGFQLKTADKGKGQMAFEYTAHYSISKQDVVPYELYIKAGTAEA